MVSAANNDQQQGLPFRETRRMGFATPVVTSSDEKNDQTGVSSPKRQQADQTTVTSPEKNDNPTNAKLHISDLFMKVVEWAKYSQYGWLFPVGILATGYLIFHIWVLVREKY